MPLTQALINLKEQQEQAEQVIFMFMNHQDENPFGGFFLHLFCLCPPTEILYLDDQDSETGMLENSPPNRQILPLDDYVWCRCVAMLSY